MIEQVDYIENGYVFAYRVAATGIIRPQGYCARYAWIEETFPATEEHPFVFTVSSSDYYEQPVHPKDLGAWFHFLDYAAAFAFVTRWAGVQDTIHCHSAYKRI
ncbi:MAG: hypothetical protein EOP84_13700 [Verrucomicrobiaceae bacterium]|nr:MAG: hypothetical protein EOP84_13700 [Verrucomicrobiaceae bacterium]